MKFQASKGDSSVSIVRCVRAERGASVVSRLRNEEISSSPGCSGRAWALPAFYSVGTSEFFHWDDKDGGMRLITHLCQDTWLKIRGALLSLPQTPSC
jgi:hypothetical protein